MIWTLTICTSLTWGMCSAIHYREFPSEDSCYKARAALMQDAKDKPSWALCAPKSSREG